jgi:DNA invertase Pin-like site-specific DNA recombinase
MLSEWAATMRVAFYARVSTEDQTLENQLQALQGVADKRGWQVVETYTDFAISGAKGRLQRPGLDRLCKDAQRGKFDLVAAWSIDRLGRSLQDLLNTLALFDACHIDLYLDRQSIDTSMPMGRLVFQVIGAFGEFERSMIRDRVKAGMKRAVAAGKRVGRPTTDAALLAQAKAEAEDERAESRLDQAVAAGQEPAWRRITVRHHTSLIGDGIEDILDLAVCRAECDGAVAVQKQPAAKGATVVSGIGMGAGRDGVAGDGDTAARDKTAAVHDKNGAAHSGTAAAGSSCP